MTNKSIVPNIYRRRLDGFCRLRFDTCFLPDTIEGRNLLIALLRFGLTDESAAEQAPWGEAELATLKRRAKRKNWRAVGKLIGLTFDEWKAAKLWMLRPIDASEQDIKDWRKDQRKSNDAERKRKKREGERKRKQAKLAIANLLECNPRHVTILEMLINSGEPMSVSDLVKEARKSHAFTRASCRNTTWCSGPPKHAIVRNLPFVVRRTLDQLEAKGIIETYKRSGKHGLEIQAKLNIRSFSTTKLTSTPAHSVLARNADLPRVFAKMGLSASLGSGHVFATPPTPTAEQAEHHGRGGLVIAFPTPPSTNAEPERKAA
jgi:hypothetical protein